MKLIQDYEEEHFPIEPAAWTKEIEARIAEIDAGKVELASAEVVLQRIKGRR